MAEADPEHLNESILFHEEGPVAGTQDIRSNKGSAPWKDLSNQSIQQDFRD